MCNAINLKKDNFNEIAEKFIKGCYEANNYNSECFSMMEINRARAMDYGVDEMIIRTENAGYSSHLFDTILNKYKMSWEEPAHDKELKHVLDDDFLIDLSQFQQTYNYACAL